MNHRKRERLINRIMTGKLVYSYSGQDYTISTPTLEDKCAADDLYDQTVLESIYDELYNEENVLMALSFLNLWQEQDNEKLEKLDKKLENLKVELYNNRMSSDKIKSITRNIEQTILHITTMHERRHSLDHITIDGYANLVRRQYLISKMVQDKIGNYILKNDSEFRTLENIFQFISSNQISIEEIRELARSEPWRSYWEISKPKPFSSEFNEWSDEQRALVKYSKMYDNIFAHSECPADFVVENDYMLDGWIIIQNRKREKDSKNAADDLVGVSVAKHNELFIMAQNAANPLAPTRGEIEKLNDDNAKQIKRARQQTINKGGKVKEAALPDVQMDLMNRQNERIKNG